MTQRKYIVTIIDDGSRQSEESIRELECQWDADEIEPCEDCISRQEAISAIQDRYYDHVIGIDIVDMIAHMPAAIPEQLGEHFAEGYKKGIENE